MKKRILLLGLIALIALAAQAKKVHNRFEVGNDSVSTRLLLQDSIWNKTLVDCRRGDTIVVTVGASEYNDQDKVRHSTIEEMENNLLQMAAEAKKKKVNLLLVAPEGDYIAKVKSRKSKAMSQESRAKRVSS